MAIKSEGIFKMEFQHSIIHWGCENSSEGEDVYRSFLLPFNVGDNITRENKTYTVTSKDWDYDNNTIYFVAKQSQ